MSEQNKAAQRRLYEEVFNKGNLSVIDEVVSPDIVDHNPGPGVPPTREGFKQFVSTNRAAFPDIRIEVNDILAEGEKVVARFTMRGTHRGELMGIAPTGKQVTVSGIDILRWEGGKAVEHWGNMDDLGLLQQLGVVPT